MNASTKKVLAEELLQCGDVAVHFDPRASGVVLPERLRKGPSVFLPALSVFVRGPIDDGFRLPILEQEQFFEAFAPWETIFALVLIGGRGEGHVWTEDMPHDLPVADRRICRLCVRLARSVMPAR